jgi:extracellular factor (EF) 3-hydroxypalmitic acid methyl ester biosynthesis protein
MQNVLNNPKVIIYPTDALYKEIKENALFIGEEREKYTKYLAEATELFNKKLEDIEKRCYDPSENPEELLKATEKEINEVLYICEEFEQRVKDKDIIRDVRIRFHEKTNPILSKSYCINRARTWPQGYQGDYKTMETIYKNIPLSENIGYYLDLWSLNVTLSVAVRNRIKKLEEILRDEILKRQKPSVLNIACGSCREVFELTPEIEKSGAKFTCIDLDNDALSFAANRLSYTSISPLTSNQVELRKYNALRMFDDELNMREFGKQDIIYTVGLFDYVPDDFFVSLLGALYRLLNPGGKLITVLPDAEQYRSQDYHWIVDWDGLLQRTEKDYNDLLYHAGILESVITTREKSGVFIFYMATK